VQFSVERLRRQAEGCG